MQRSAILSTHAEARPELDSMVAVGDAISMGFADSSWRVPAAATLLAVGLGLTIFTLCSAQTEEERIAEQLARLADVVSIQQGENLIFRKARLNREFSELFTPTATIVANEIGPIARGPDGLATAGAALARLFQTGDASLSGVEIELSEDASTATVRGDARFSGNRPGQGFRTDTRTVKLELVKQDGDWLVHQGRVGGSDEASVH